MGLGRQCVTEVAEVVFERTEDPVIGEIDELVGQLLQKTVGVPPEGLEELLATSFTTF